MEDDDDGVNLSQYMHETARPIVLLDSQTGSHFMDFSGMQLPDEDRRLRTHGKVRLSRFRSYYELPLDGVYHSTCCDLHRISAESSILCLLEGSETVRPVSLHLVQDVECF